MTEAEWLQWSRGSITAETSTAGSASRRRTGASMEPRFDNRGNNAGKLHTLCYLLLQWSRGSITAETGLSGFDEDIRIVASMEPRFDNRGNRVRDDVGVVVSHASMEPRFDNRGNARPGDVARRDSGASMEPRFDNRGNGGKVTDWGELDGASMEPRFDNRGNARSRPVSRSSAALQWSRGSITAETWRSATRSSGDSRFNGAAVR